MPHDTPATSIAETATTSADEAAAAPAMRQRPRDARYVCYPYMREKACTVDMEIRTDSLCTAIGFAASFTAADDALRADLHWLMQMSYHVNGSVRGRMAVTEPELLRLSDLYDAYRAPVAERTRQFVLPQGTTLAGALHMARSEAKKSVRAMPQLSREREVPRLLFDFLGLMANTLFVMALFDNQRQGVQEVVFTSRSYDVRGAQSDAGD